TIGMVKSGDLVSKTSQFVHVHNRLRRPLLTKANRWPPQNRQVVSVSAFALAKASGRTRKLAVITRDVKIDKWGLVSEETLRILVSGLYTTRTRWGRCQRWSCPSHDPGRR